MYGISIEIIALVTFLTWFSQIYSSVEKIPWKSPQIIENRSLEYLIQHNHVSISTNSCLTNTASAGHGVNGFYGMNPADALEKKSSMLPGHTVWINEFLAVGHVSYDLYLMQVLASQHIDRIIFQRSLCAHGSNCQGIERWYYGYFSALLNAFQPDIPIYLRIQPHETRLLANYFNIEERNRHDDLPFIDIKNSMCFDHLYCRYCNHCSRDSISSPTVQAFKAAAYKIASNKTQSNLTIGYNISQPIIVTFAHRGYAASRHMKNPELLYGKLISSFPDLVIRIFNSSENNKHYFDQIALVGSSHVVIAEHGSFQSNIIYMRNHSLFIDLRGKYTYFDVFEMYEALASMFGVLFSFVTTAGLTSHSQHEFAMTENECDEVIDIIKAYSHLKPYVS